MALNDADFQWVQTYFQDLSGNALASHKAYLINTRLVELAHEESIELVALMSRLREGEDKALIKKFIHKLTTHETFFFRDGYPFELLRNQIIPALLETQSTKRSLRIWSPACSTGQEPYSIAMLLGESFPELLSTWSLSILATDISKAVLEYAKVGSYSTVEINRGLSKAQNKQHFIEKEGRWEIQAKLKKLIEFKELNLAQPFVRLPVYDIIFLRNVLIYFDKETKSSILAQIAKHLQPQGYLMLGTGETTIGLSDKFQTAPFNKPSCYQLKP